MALAVALWASNNLQEDLRVTFRATVRSLALTCAWDFYGRRFYPRWANQLRRLVKGTELILYMEISTDPPKHPGGAPHQSTGASPQFREHFARSFMERGSTELYPPQCKRPFSSSRHRSHVVDRSEYAGTATQHHRFRVPTRWLHSNGRIV